MVIVLALLAAFAVPVVHFVAVEPLVQEVPRWDQWSLVPLWEAHFAGEPVLPHLLSPYNGHYNVVPRIIFYLFGRLTDWDLRAEVVLCYLAATATMIVLVLMLRDSGPGFLLLAPLVSLQVFSLVQFENFVSGYPFGQLLSQLGAIASLFLVTGPRLGRWHLLASGFAASIASFSWGAGLAAWGVGGLAIAWRRGRSVILVPWAAGFAISLYFAWKGAHSVGLETSIPWSSTDLWRFPFTMLGAVVSPGGNPTLFQATTAGVVLVVVFLCGIAGNLLIGRRDLVVRWGLLGVLALAGASLISLGRAPAGLGQALASHYATTAYPLVVASLVLVVSVLTEIAAKRAGLVRWVSAAALALLLVHAATDPVRTSHHVYRVIRSWNNMSAPMAYVLVEGHLSDQEIQRYFHPHPNLVRRGISLLDRHDLAVYREPSPER